MNNPSTNDFCKSVKDSQGRVTGLWVANPADPDLKTYVEDFHARESLPPNIFQAFQRGRYRLVPNKFDDNGGAFLMFAGNMLPGEWDITGFIIAILIIAGCFLSSLIFEYPLHFEYAVVSVMVIALGIKGFSARGIPLTSNYYITGTTARVVGVIVMFIGVGIFYFRDILQFFMGME